MSRLNPQQRLIPTIKDRLTDPDAGGTQANPWFSVREMEQAVLRDLRGLLGTHLTKMDVPKEYTEVCNSIYVYGLPDITSLNELTNEQQSEIARLIEETVARFEPRLRNVKVRLLKPTEGKQRAALVHLDARLALDPAPEMAVETVLDLATGHYDELKLAEPRS